MHALCLFELHRNSRCSDLLALLDNMVSIHPVPRSMKDIAGLVTVQRDQLESGNQALLPKKHSVREER